VKFIWTFAGAIVPIAGYWNIAKQDRDIRTYNNAEFRYFQFNALQIYLSQKVGYQLF
jgi:hypothetical protein